jgi:hypothetical protein
MLRGERVLLDTDLARLYGVETGALNRAVTRHSDRFPADFSFQLTRDEIDNLRCQFGISSWGGRRYPPRAFTELNRGQTTVSGIELKGPARLNKLELGYF